MNNLSHGERLSDWLSPEIKKWGKLYRLSQNTYKEIVQMFENPSNIKLAEGKIVEALNIEKREEVVRRSKMFAEKFGKPIQMPRTPHSKQKKAA